MLLHPHHTSHHPQPTIPHVRHSVNRRDISGAELALLLSASRAADLADPGQPLALHAYSYWCSQAGACLAAAAAAAAAAG